MAPVAPVRMTRAAPAGRVQAITGMSSVTTMRALLPRRSPAVICAEHLDVAAALIGQPLASPWRRLAAIGIDAALVTLMSAIGNGLMLAGVACLLWRQIRRDALVPWQRTALGTVAALGIALGAIAAWQEDVPPAQERGTEEKLEAVIREVVLEAAPAHSPATEIQHLQQRVANLEAALASERDKTPPSLRQRLEQEWNRIGLGYGWGLVYFSLLPVLWPGQTPGKRWLKLRVVELTGRPLSALDCFKRYGGYAAGMATGLIGFAQLLWDDNRQTIQDKIAHTAVIDVR